LERFNCVMTEFLIYKKSEWGKRWAAKQINNNL